MSGGVCSMAPKSYYSAPRCLARVPVKAASPSIRSSWEPNRELEFGSFKGSCVCVCVYLLQLIFTHKF